MPFYVVLNQILHVNFFFFLKILQYINNQQFVSNCNKDLLVKIYLVNFSAN